MTEEQSERVFQCLMVSSVVLIVAVLADTSYFRDWRPSPEGFSLMPSALAWGKQRCCGGNAPGNSPQTIVSRD